MDPVERPSESPAPGETPPVLIVDDSENIRGLFANVLKEEGYGTLQAADGVEALQILEQQSVSLVLLDCQMPRMDGIQCLETLREREVTRSVPVIMVTGLTEVADRVRGLAAGANDYLTKPVSIAELVARVKAHLRDRTYWTSLIERDLRDRRAIAAALGRIRAEVAPEETAQRMIDQLAQILGIPAAALFRFDTAGRLVPLATRGALARAFWPGVPVAAGVAAHVAERLRSGPWVEVPTGLGDDDPFEVLLADLGIRATAFAPLQYGQNATGILQIALTHPRSSHPREELAHRLPALVDFAGFAGAMLGPTLAAVEQINEARAALRAVIDRRAFSPVFQPIVHIHAYRVVGYEALTRFADGTRPDLRFAEAATLGLGLPLELASLRASLDHARRLPEDAFLSLNVSPALILEHKGLATLLADASREVVLELTEHVQIDDYFMLRAAITDLGREVRVAVDDAGAGFASMRHILELHPHFVKLDQGLIRGIHESTAQQALVAGMAFFGSRTDCRIIAEGVETATELACLEQLGIPLGQGYLLGRPQPVDETSR